MREVQLKDADDRLSAVIDDVRNGEDVVITRDGRKEAVVMSWAAWQRLSDVPSFARLLMSSPVEDGDLPDRNSSPLRDLAFSRS